MSSPVDWRRLFGEWESVPAELKARILALFREKPKDKLADLFKREPDALRLYEKVVGRWVPPAPPAPPPKPVETGLRKENERLLESIFLTTLTEARVSPSTARGYLHEFDVELHRLREELKDVPRDRAVRLAEDSVRAKAGDVLLRIPPPRVAPPPPAIVPEQVPVRVRVEEVRRPEMEERECWVCGRKFMIDRDLEKRVSEYTTEIRGRARFAYTGPLLGFPMEFYYSCEEHRDEKYGYRDIYDAVAFQVVESRRSKGKVIRLTKEILRDTYGFNDDDIAMVQVRAVRWELP